MPDGRAFVTKQPSAYRIGSIESLRANVERAAQLFYSAGCQVKLERGRLYKTLWYAYIVIEPSSENGVVAMGSGNSGDWEALSNLLSLILWHAQNPIHNPLTPKALQSILL